jgi:inactivated superfamily I helicase
MDRIGRAVAVDHRRRGRTAAHVEHERNFLRRIEVREARVRADSAGAALLPTQHQRINCGLVSIARQ